ncbi:outer membrane protein assembly factor BamD [Mariniblastus fucicola]|uniref:Outer membrane protein assembly factor BamD n=1 Tax=Mariniblastus fucicola TaxID=980251 RepID=A0A5B9P6G1_9BACT|nr:outer membrane protein assembly factor BamD [Mariniblastus fucicola]QEG22177.1 Outer membrane protein assembly factor BamD [Mariniblastus fucicola]
MRPTFRTLTLLVTLALFAISASGCGGFKFNGKKQSLLDRIAGKTGKKDPRSEMLADEALDPLGHRDGNRLLLDDLAPSQIGTTLRIRSGTGISEESANRHFANATEIYERALAAKQSGADSSTWQTTFVEAANEYRIAAAKWPDSGLEEQAIFFEGESYFFADRYVQANRAFEKLIAQYSGSSYLDQAEERRYVISKYWLELSESGPMVSLNDPKRPRFNVAGEARRVLHNIRLDDPTGKLSDDATFELANAFLKSGRYYEAADTYEDLRRNYPGSKYLFNAHMLELEARLKSYNGPSYDATPLEKSEQLLKSIVRQFPKEAQEKREVLEQQAALVNNQLAQRDFELGRYHERRGENRAAQLCYAAVEERYPDSVYSSSIGESIQKVAQLPPVPTQHAEWLVNMFPDPEADKPVITSGDNETIFR